VDRNDAVAIVKRAGCARAWGPLASCACALQRPRRTTVATCAGLLVIALSGARAGAADAPAPLAPPLAHAPLATVRVAGGYGELRSNHFHAGVDLSTGGKVGAVVFAPLAGHVERVRASGVGYGRSLYLRAEDGRLFVFGHLDAFAPAVAAYVDSAQRASAQYDQDLWPAPGRFRFAAGERVAWSGESGGGGPHMHFEIRHEDFALNPLRAGLAIPASEDPRLLTLTLEPLDPHARIAGVASPRTIPLHGGPDTLVVEGDVRALVLARAGLPGVEDTPAWSVSMEWGSETIEARLDSISWAGEMSEVDELVDRGRVSGSGGTVLWAPASWRPRFLRTSAAPGEEAGRLRVEPGDPARPLRLIARDASGREVERSVVLRPAAPGDPTRTSAPGGAGGGGAKPAEPRWWFESLPGSHLRVKVAGTPAGLHAVSIATRGTPAVAEAATWDGEGWNAILHVGRDPDAEGLVVRGSLPGGESWERSFAGMRWPAGEDLLLQPGAGATLALARDGLYEPGIVVTSLRPVATHDASGLAGITPVLRVQPERLALRHPAPIRWTLPEGADPARVGLYRRSGGEWENLRARFDPATRVFATETSFLGEFALMRDVTAPVVTLRAPARRAAKGAYSRWQLVASVSEPGSGVDTGESAFTVDGRREPSEWDPEENQMRWRPLRAPAPGRHRYDAKVVDRAGNATVRHGTFVLDSAVHANH